MKLRHTKMVCLFLFIFTKEFKNIFVTIKIRIDAFSDNYKKERIKDG